MNIFWRAVATIVIWAAVAGIVITSFIMDASSDAAIIAPLVAAIIAMLPIWTTGSDDEDEKTKESASIEKAKRSGSAAAGVDKEEARLRMLMELMDPEEREAFKETLKQQMLHNLRDGELPYGANTIESLLDDDPGEGKRLRG